MDVSRRSVLGALAGATAARAKQKPRPNFVFILADDHAGYVLGCDGNRQAETPHLDRLAGESMRFARHHCNAPVCTPSRQSLFTGQLPHAAGVTRLPTPLSLEKPTLAKQLRAAGYRTAVFGKMHFNRRSFPGMFGFETIMTEEDVAHAWQAQVTPRPVPPEIRTKPPWHPFRDPARIWLNADKLPYPRYDADMKGTFIVRQAQAYLEQQRQAQQPFALWVSFMEPHSPYDFPVEDRERFDPARFVPPRVGPEDGWQIPLIFRELNGADKRGIAAAYYTSVRFLDKNIGLVLDKLRELRLEEDTFLVYAADHGYDLGQHGRFEKHCGYDPALRVPLLMRFPGQVRPGVVEDLTEHIDVPATILDMLGADPLPVTHGQSLRPYLEGRAMATPRDHIFSEYLENEEAYIRTQRYKFIYCTGKRARQDGYKTDNPTPGRYVRLYDHQQDPGEFTDVAGQHPDLVRKFQGLMLERFRKTHPEAANEPARLSVEDALDWYLRPRDV
ncbi:MAG TPA: sulfatase-like hydrolase/transferase [Bryobacteraceae bacterium]|nr:sulfatase-like hydrolase/transferase [Bryobacteraceae bacterium]